MRLLSEDTDQRFLVRLVPTYIDASLGARLWTGVTGILRASTLLLFGFADVLHVHFSLRGSIVRKSVPLFIARLRGVPTIAHCHSSHFFTWLDELPPLLRRAVRAALHADYSVVLGQSHLKESCVRLGFDESNTRVLYNPVVMPAVAPAPRPRRASGTARRRRGSPARRELGPARRSAARRTGPSTVRPRPHRPCRGCRCRRANAGPAQRRQIDLARGRARDRQPKPVGP